ncbi:MAG TPA: DNA mismatch repair endonuclease MutL [Beijerinckiaceae bacterium]|nr:DNA mismatch repair endonuclease MutL [Beijerinckiaceae bacterium]
MPIRRLDPVLVDRIAAGEVVERPAAAVKELVENALDAGATRVDIVIEAGGRRLIRVADDGCGMNGDDLILSVERHATSKLPDEDLFAIGTFGFRGEALPSIAAVSRLEIVSRHEEESAAHSLAVDAGNLRPSRPAARARGTTVEVRDLFAAVPARLKFLKGDRAEATAVADVVKRLAMAHPNARFTLSGDGIAALDYAHVGEGPEGLARRIAEVMGREFRENSVALDLAREGLSIKGFAGLPAYTRASASSIHLFVNGRPVRDKLLTGAVRGAYTDLLPAGRYPSIALYLAIDPRAVDVNVHPAKAEVRFREAGLVRALVVTAIGDALRGAGIRPVTQASDRALAAFGSGGGLGRAPYREAGWNHDAFAPIDRASSQQANRTVSAALGFAEGQENFDYASRPSGAVEPQAHEPTGAADTESFPLGAARAQLHENYIIAQTRDGLVIVDQHAAHERLVYERLKRERSTRGVERQIMLTPEIVDLDPSDCAKLLEQAKLLEELGLIIEPFGPGAVAIREAPTALAPGKFRQLVTDLVDSFEEWGTAAALERKLDHVLATMACHGSVRSGRRLRAEEMDALLRQMEKTPGAEVCNHGRPTFIVLKLADIERLFGRR